MKTILAFILAISLWTSAHSVVQAQVTLQCGNIIDSCGFPSPPVPAFYTTTNQLLQYTPTALGIDYPRIVNVAIHLVANSSGQLAVTPAQATASFNARSLKCGALMRRIQRVLTDCGLL